MTFVNASATRRVWTRLVNTQTGTTLELDPGETAEVGVVRFEKGVAVLSLLPDDFQDEHLQPVPTPEPRRRSVEAEEVPAEIPES